jgi:UDP-N-acetylglucosamine 2-epimerase (non-hydrolysing)
VRPRRKCVLTEITTSRRSGSSIRSTSFFDRTHFDRSRSLANLIAANYLPTVILLTAGTRPNFMKVAPIFWALERRASPVRLVHTGQHFDAAMSDVFFRDLGLPEPHIALRAGGGSHAEQTAAVLVGMERELMALRPEVLVVVGDVTSTLAAALAAAKLGIPVAHVEAGLRSGDWTMPEEVNRVLTDQLSDLLLTPSMDAGRNLVREGIAEERIVFVGNVMIDSLRRALGRRTDALKRFRLERNGYALATLHRPANVDSPESLAATLDALAAIGRKVPVLFPVHPRTLARAEAFGLLPRLRTTPGLSIIEPVGYDDFVTLMEAAALVATDSGGIQEETTALGVACLTMRNGTERPVTVTQGTNTVVGLDVPRIEAEVDAILSGKGKKGRAPDGWDGRAGERIADALLAFLAGSPPPKTSGPRA